MTVAQNIASPLRLRGEARIDERVKELAAQLHIEAFLERLPSELSGGQQQRVALARALAKNAPLMLLDEPLVNLDYKLREELRDELSQLFARGESTVVYATTEPTEALLLGGYTAVLHEGELLQYGPTAEVFRRPKSIRVARAFSDPPINLIAGSDGTTIGIRAGMLRLQGRDRDLVLRGTVELAEISGSDTFVHAATPVGELVAQLTGVHVLKLGEALTLHYDPSQALVFDRSGNLA
jgi:glycerol transport system ATP-binding protein